MLDTKIIGFMGAAKRKMRTTTETQRTQRIAELKKGGGK